MKIAVRYQSRGGNTKAVAELIAQLTGVTGEAIDQPVDENVDVLFLGGGVYMWDMDENLKKYMEQLDPRKTGKIVAFSTTGYMNVTIKRIKEYGKKKGIPVSEESLLPEES